jgi:subtilisin family serine protease
MIRIAWFFLLAVQFLPAQPVQGRFILEWESSPTLSARQRDQRQATLHRTLQSRRGRILHSFHRLLDATVVEAPNLTAADLETLPGVRRAFPVLRGHLHLDRALALNGISAAWAQLGAWERAGEGMKIAILDTGIDISHPGFQDDSLPIPEGFPRANRDSDLAAANHKVIVNRSYEDLLPGFTGQPSVRDVIGHGTAVAMAAAGVPHQAPVGWVAGAAPKAWLGAYKIFGGPDGSTTSDIFIRALEDAVNDGMDVINISLGFTPVARPEDDPIARAVERAIARGVIVVQSAGNRGPEPASTSSPGQAPNIITVGAQPNDRVLMATVTAGAETTLPALAGRVVLPEPLTAPAADVAALDGAGLACQRLPAESLTGAIAVILRGECDFETKLFNAEAAGARGAVIYSDERPIGPWDPQRATLPALMVSNASGRAIRRLMDDAAGDLTLTLRFQNGAFPADPITVSEFSSRGPSPVARIQPDLIAVGQALYTAAVPGAAEVASDAGYRAVNGTSFSAPLVAGAAAVLKAARPGLTPAQYRSLLTNTAAPIAPNGDPLPVLSTGAGMLNLDAALRARATVVPATLSFGAAASSANLFAELRLTNLAQEPETYAITVQPRRGPPPQPSSANLTLDPGESHSLGVSWNFTDLAPGGYDGFLLLTAASSGATLRVPYWCGVRGDTPAAISAVNLPDSGRPGASVRFFLRVLDAAGLPLFTEPQVTALNSTADVLGVRLVDSLFPGHWVVDVRLSPVRGLNRFRVTAGELSREFAISGN